MTKRTKAVSVAALGVAVMWGCASTATPSSDGGTGKTTSEGDSGSCNPPGHAACQIDPQCGCPSGQKCDFAADSGATCLNAGGGASGSQCHAASDCAASLTCASGVCRPFCPATLVGSPCPTASSGPTLGLCAQVDVNAAAVLQDSYCFFECTPSPNDCPAGQGCIVTTVEGTNYPDCQTAGPVAAGGACTTVASCAAGTACYTGGEAGSLCLQLCRTTTDCANLGATFQCDTTIGTAVAGVLYGLCHD